MNEFAEKSLSDESLQRELQNKDDIITALTEQLEGAVDQLDRLKRSGVKQDSGSGGFRSPGGLASQVGAALAAFDELAPAEHFERIEDGISQILQLLSHDSLINLQSRPRHAEDEDSSDQDQISDDRFWEETKARLLESENISRTDSPESVAKSPSSEQATESDNRDGAETNETNWLIPALPDPPRLVTDLKDIVGMEEGLSERDSYIAYLIARLRNLENSRYQLIDWEELAGVPTKLIEEMLSLKKQLEEQLRQSEIAVALERAALTRERSKLFQVKQYLAQEVKRLGSTESVKEMSASPESRWGKFFETKKES